uniref:Uncharacterized protein n=1 Tax=Trichobilharzia regenti TaxID=157069 RepID=A0AA85JBY9_TRIRE|nr:unnamed protein product [Trichobilharzia regenti]
MKAGYRGKTWDSSWGRFCKELMGRLGAIQKLGLFHEFAKNLFRGTDYLDYASQLAEKIKKKLEEIAATKAPTTPTCTIHLPGGQKITCHDG